MKHNIIYDIVNDEGLNEKYIDDVSRGAIVFFKNKNLSIKDLLEFQKKYETIYPWDPKYNDIRLNFNRSAQFFPKMIIKIHTKKDVLWILDLCIKHNIKFTIRSGAHCSNSYSSCNEVVIDTNERNTIRFNHDFSIVKVGAGVLLGSVLEQLCERKKFIPHGTCGSVSLVGLSIGCGIGIMRRKYGLTMDNMLSATIILADKTIIKTSKNNYPDLFWAIRGAGSGNFGLITDLSFKTHDIVKVALFELWIPFHHFEEAVDIWQRWAPIQHNNLTSFIHLNSRKNKEIKEAIYISGQFDGKKSELIKILQIFNRLVTSSKIWYTKMLDCELHHFNPNPPLFYSYLNLFAIEYLSQKAIKNLKKIMNIAPETFRIEIDSMGGKISEISNTSTSFFWRNALFWINLRGATMSQEELIDTAKYVRLTYNQLLNDGLRNDKTKLPMSYCNFKDPELTQKEYPLVYWGDNTEKLIQIKNKYDPNNIFNYTQSIPL